MKRKVVQQGPATLMVSLPSKWVKRYGVKKGDEIELEEENSNIVIKTMFKKEIKRAEIDVSGLDYSSIRHVIRAAYKLGYEEIFLRFDNEETLELKTKKTTTVMKAVNKEVGILLGCEIFEQKRDSCLIKDYSISSIEQFEPTLRRVFILLVQYSKDLVEGATTMDKIFLEGMEEKHDNVTKFLFFCLRLLNMKGYTDYNKTMVLYYLISALDHILDINKYCARDLTFLKQKKINKNTIEVLKDISDQIENYYHYYYKLDKNRVKVFSESRWKIIERIKNLSGKIPSNELYILTNMEHCLELLLHLFEARQSLEL